MDTHKQSFQCDARFENVSASEEPKDLPGREESTLFLSDKDIASELRMSVSWVRKQRWLRRRGREHVFTVDPVLIGSTPRYRHSDVQTWMEELNN